MLRDHFTQPLPLIPEHSEVDALFFIYGLRATAEDITWSALQDGYDAATAAELVADWDDISRWRADNDLTR